MVRITFVLAFVFVALVAASYVSASAGTGRTACGLVMRAVGLPKSASCVVHSVAEKTTVPNRTEIVA